MEKTIDLTGPEKAVLLLLSLDEATATPIIAELDTDDVRKLREIAAMMRTIPATSLNQVYKEFVERTREAVAVPRGGVHYLNRIARRAFGDVRAQEIFSDAPQSAMERLNAADAVSLSAVLENEHPQLIAAVMSQLDADKAAHIIERLPEELQPAVIERLGVMTEVPAGLLEEIASALSAELPSNEAEAVMSVDGVSRSAAVVRKLNREAGEALLGSIEQDNAELATEIRRAMYSFEDLKALDGKALRSLLEAVSVEKLTLALKTASEQMKEHFFSSLSKRAADRIREDLEVMGAVRLADVEAAQQEIVEAALRLEAEGVLSLDSGGKDVV